MKYRSGVLPVLRAIAIIVAAYGTAVIRRGFSAADQPSSFEKVVARAARNLAIPSRAKNEKNPLTASPEILQEARERFTNQCVNCHGKDGTGRAEIGAGAAS